MDITVLIRMSNHQAATITQATLPREIPMAFRMVPGSLVKNTRRMHNTPIPMNKYLFEAWLV